ncbi:MAG: NADH-quinone oxidoreductase subunit M [Chloroflexota bacterium]|nr:NADH-quinone oxidoreductase subunit M [Chloroflexota bacterium]
MGIPILSVITFTPLAGALLLLLIRKDQEELIARLALAVTVVPLILAFVLWANYDQAAGGMQFTELHEWIPVLNSNYTLGLDGLSLPLVLLAAGLSFLATFYSNFTIKERVKEYFMSLLMLEMGMFGVFLSLDFVLFYVFWEIGLVPMLLLIALWGGPRREYAAIKFFLFTLTGSVGMLLAIIAVYLETGTFGILEAAAAQPFAGNFTYAATAFWAFFIAFAIKLPSFPIHTWLPDAHTEAPVCGSVLLAGVLLKLGAYGLLRIALPLFPQIFGYYSVVVPILPILAVISIVYGAMVCMAQWDLKKLIAYSSVSHMGYVLLGICGGAAGIYLGGDKLSSANLALNGAAMQMFTHGITTGGLFFLVGVIYDRAHTRELKAFGGLGTQIPYFYGMMLVTCFASLGLPGLIGFWSEFFVFRGSMGTIPTFAIIGGLGIVFTAGYILWNIVQHMFLGEPKERWAHLSDMEWWEKATLWPLIATMLVFGIYPTPILNLINVAMESMTRTLVR